MRVQVYQEELGPGVEFIQQTSRNGEVFHGLRVWLNTCQELLDHSTETDDDRSAVTFWFRNRQDAGDFIDEIDAAYWVSGDGSNHR